MKRRTHPVKKSGQSPWQRYNKGKGGGTGGIGPGSMWLDRIHPSVAQDATPEVAPDLIQEEAA